MGCLCRGMANVRLQNDPIGSMFCSEEREAKALLPLQLLSEWR